jgi:hypothetical protein
LAQRIALAALAIFLMLNAVTPFITPDPPWLANLPLVVAIMAFLLAFGLSHIRAERARATNPNTGKGHPRGAEGARAVFDIPAYVPHLPIRWAILDYLPVAGLIISAAVIARAS